MSPAIVSAAKHVLSYNTARITKTITTPPGSTDALPPFGEPLRQLGLSPSCPPEPIGSHRLPSPP